MLAILAPGQGSQSPAMLAPWCEDAALRSFVEETSAAIELDLMHLGTQAGADEINNTAVAQPLIVIAGFLGYRALGITPSLVAGHSVGEITAAGFAGVISEADALSLVRTRGKEMAEVAATTDSGMSAILGGERADVLAAITQHGLVAANDNGAGQIVAAGERGALEELASNPPAGARVRALAVAGAFHSPLMAAVRQPLQAHAATLSLHAPSMTILSNKDGAAMATGEEVIARIVEQVAQPVRWDLCMSALVSAGVTGVIEVPPAGTLVGLLKRNVPAIETFALKTPDDLAAARKFAAAHR